MAVDSTDPVDWAAKGAVGILLIYVPFLAVGGVLMLSNANVDAPVLGAVADHPYSAPATFALALLAWFVPLARRGYRESTGGDLPPPFWERSPWRTLFRAAGTLLLLYFSMLAAAFVVVLPAFVGYQRVAETLLPIAPVLGVVGLFVYLVWWYYRNG